MQAKVESLVQASMKLGEAAYQAEQSAAEAAGTGTDAPGADAGPEPAEGPEDVVDADFEEVEEVEDEDKKSSSG